MDGVEADDLISSVTQHRSLKDYNKIINSIIQKIQTFKKNLYLL